MEDTPNQHSLSKDVGVKGSIKFGKELIFGGDLEGVNTSVAGGTFVGGSEVTPSRGGLKDVAVAQKEELHKIGAPR